MAVPIIQKRIAALLPRMTGSVRSFEEKHGIANGTIGALSTGKRTKPSPQVLQRVADAFGVPVSWILGEGPDTPPGPSAEPRGEQTFVAWDREPPAAPGEPSTFRERVLGTGVPPELIQDTTDAQQRIRYAFLQLALHYETDDAIVEATGVPLATMKSIALGAPASLRTIVLVTNALNRILGRAFKGDPTKVSAAQLLKLLPEDADLDDAVRVWLARPPARPSSDPYPSREVAVALARDLVEDAVLRSVQQVEPPDGKDPGADWWITEIKRLSKVRDDLKLAIMAAPSPRPTSPPDDKAPG